MSIATLTINSRNYGAWSLRGWLLCRIAGLDFTVEVVDNHDPELGPSCCCCPLVPRAPARARRRVVWDTLAIAEYLHELLPERALLPADTVARARCRSVSGRDALGLPQSPLGPAHEHQGAPPGFQVWAGAQADIDRIVAIWAECLAASGGPYLFGESPPWPTPCTRRCAPGFAPTTSRSAPTAADYVETVLGLPEMVEWMRRRPSRSPTTSKSSRWSSDRPSGSGWPG